MVAFNLKLQIPMLMNQTYKQLFKLESLIGQKIKKLKGMHELKQIKTKKIYIFNKYRQAGLTFRIKDMILMINNWNDLLYLSFHN